MQIPSRHRLLGFLAQRLKQRDRDLNGPWATHPNMEATQAEEKETAAPSWSADSECSDTDLATKEAEAEDTCVQQTETPLNLSEASSTLEKRSGGALGGWLTRLTGAYSVAGKNFVLPCGILGRSLALHSHDIEVFSCGCAVRGLGGSLLVRGDRMNDFAETKDRLDRTAAGKLAQSSAIPYQSGCFLCIKRGNKANFTEAGCIRAIITLGCHPCQIQSPL